MKRSLNCVRNIGVIPYDASYQGQIYQDYRTGQIALRGKNGGTWQAWRTALDSSNYGTYSTFSGTVSASAMQVNGTITANNAYFTTSTVRYSDYAELFACAQELPVGTPVSIISHRTVTRYNGRNFAGVVSEKPGMIIGNELVSLGVITLPIALSGSVKVYTQDKNIKAGDELVITQSGDVVLKDGNNGRYIGIAQDDHDPSNLIMVLIK